MRSCRHLGIILSSTPLSFSKIRRAMLSRMSEYLRLPFFPAMTIRAGRALTDQDLRSKDSGHPDKESAGCCQEKRPEQGGPKEYQRWSPQVLGAGELGPSLPPPHFVSITCGNYPSEASRLATPRVDVPCSPTILQHTLEALEHRESMPMFYTLAIVRAENDDLEGQLAQKDSALVYAERVSMNRLSDQRGAPRNPTCFCQKEKN
ncbi:hypothetical protein Tco_1283480 [Tanacetum coccineum]